MDTDKLHRARGMQLGQPLDGTRRRTRGQSEPELGVVLAGADEFVGVHLDTGGHPDQHSGPATNHPGFGRSRGGPVRVTARGQPLDPVDLVERVHHDASDPYGQRRGQLFVRFVVAVKHQALGRHPRL